MADKKNHITGNVRFEEGTLQFDILVNAACGKLGGEDVIIGGDWVPARIQTKEGTPVWIKLDGDNLIVETLKDAMIDTKTGFFVGGNIVEIARFDVKGE